MDNNGQKNTYKRRHLAEPFLIQLFVTLSLHQLIIKMKKVLLSTFVLILFSVAIAIFEISCHKDAIAQIQNYILPPATTSKLGGVIPDGSTISVDATGKISAVNNSSQQQGKIIYIGNLDRLVYTANYDGTNPQKLNISFPSNLTLDGVGPISPDHKLIFFYLYYQQPNATLPTLYTYACNIDGTNLHLVLTGNYAEKAY